MSISHIERLIKIMSRLPSVGPRSARRIVLFLIKNKDNYLNNLIDILGLIKNSVTECEICYNIDTHSPCNICTNSKRNNDILCIVEEVSDLWALERTDNYYGKYHVIGGVLSAIDGVGPEELNIEQLIHRIKHENFKEVIFANNATIEGKSTAHYITELIKKNNLNIKQTRLAYGMPLGGELDYLDGATIKAALNARHEV